MNSNNENGNEDDGFDFLLPPPPLTDSPQDDDEDISDLDTKPNSELNRQETIADIENADTRNIDATVIGDFGDEPPSLSESSLIPLPGYDCTKVLGRGGMGIVYLATDEKLGRKVAIKLMNAFSDSSPKARARFQTEAHAIASLQHVNIAQLFAVDECDGQPFFVMEFVDGVSLDQKLERLTVFVYPHQSSTASSVRPRSSSSRWRALCPIVTAKV